MEFPCGQCRSVLLALLDAKHCGNCTCCIEKDLTLSGVVSDGNPVDVRDATPDGEKDVQGMTGMVELKGRF